MTVELKRFRFTSNPLTSARNLRYRLDHFWELREFFSRFDVEINEVAYEGFAHTGRMLARDSSGSVLLIHRFKVIPASGTIHFSKIPVGLIHGRVQSSGEGTAIITYDGFEGQPSGVSTEKEAIHG